jgi:hypothetical protein
MSKATQGIFGAISILLTSGAAMPHGAGSGPGDAPQVLESPLEAAVNRAAKADRAGAAAPPASQMRTFSIRLDDRADMSFLVRVPIVQDVRKTWSHVPLTAASEHQKAACEPVVSILTELSRQLPPSRCIT